MIEISSWNLFCKQYCFQGLFTLIWRSSSLILTAFLHMDLLYTLFIYSLVAGVQSLSVLIFETQRIAACQTSSFTVFQSLLTIMSIELVMPSNQLLQPQSFPASGSFPMIQLFASDGQTIGVSASASILPVNIQGWFPLGLTGLISLLSKGLSKVFSSTIARKQQFFGA